VDAPPGEKGVHIAPTDPEVPSAKRRGALRQRRSLIGLTAVVVSLLSITLFLLYRAGQRVAEPRGDGFGWPGNSVAGDGTIAEPARRGGGVPRVEPTAQPPSHPSLHLPDHFNDVHASTDEHAPASSAAPAGKPPVPAVDIIRTPAF
jgi:hypothetical protein